MQFCLPGLRLSEAGSRYRAESRLDLAPAVDSREETGLGVAILDEMRRRRRVVDDGEEVGQRSQVVDCLRYALDRVEHLMLRHLTP
eukprot:CAMPEP_0119081562 /NCGR_PEP_ID=MMETSP1178-20130426/117451_1 /TAXON_ID=33656 /ORGANISM="unid sp, Strain CCMP2000" /LENGTH=85 /DNA_ID=CAMNT_0007064271 /DNA_START=49 /DNA_END=302 /DNA_ORIENTATION=+